MLTGDPAIGGRSVAKRSRTGHAIANRQSHGVLFRAAPALRALDTYGNILGWSMNETKQTDLAGCLCRDVCRRGAGTAERTPTMPDNPFAERSTLPYSLPPFDRIHDEDYLPAFEAGMRAHRAEVSAHRPGPCAAGLREHHRGAGALRADAGPGIRRLLQSQLRQYRPGDAEDRFARSPHACRRTRMRFSWIRRCSRAWMPSTGGAPPAPRCRVPAAARPLSHRVRPRGRADLSEADKARLRVINGELSSLTTHFKQNVLKATQDGAVLVDDAARARRTDAGADRRGGRRRSGPRHAGQVAHRSAEHHQPAAAGRAAQSRLRERIYKASMERGLSGATDNTEVIARIVRLRAERAALLGYPNSRRVPARGRVGGDAGRRATDPHRARARGAASAPGRTPRRCRS